MICSVCGAPVGAGGRFCGSCGTALVGYTGGYVAPYVSGRLLRPRHGRVIAGVCAGFGLRYGWDPILVRLLLVLAFLLGLGTPVLVYLIAWIVMPNAPLALPMRAGSAAS